MDTEEFIKRVLPQNGTNYYTATVPPSGKFRQSKHTSVADVVNDIAKANQQRADVYFATGSFKDKRVQADTELKKCFYVDIDTGTDPSKYSSKKEAVTELLKFTTTNFLKPSLLVDSGGGIHAYWVLTDPVPLAKWQPVANSIKETCRAVGFSADESVTADAARVLRAPGSVNFKHGQGKAVSVIYEGDDYDIEELKAALSVTGPAIGIAIDNDDLSGGIGSNENRTWYAEYVVKNCPMFEDAVKTGGAGLPEALWSQQLHVLAYCEDGEDYVHEISKGYENYAWAETNLKWNQKKSAKLKEIGPTTCEKFSELSPHCAQCPMRDRVRSPLHLGADEDFTLPKGYGQTERGVYYLSPIEDDFGNTVFRKEYFLDFNIKNFHLLEEIDQGLVCSFLFVSKKKDRNVMVNVPYAEVYDNRQLVSAMARHGIAVSDVEVNLFRGLLMSWATTIQNSKGPEVVTTHLGWSDSPTQFALVENIYRKDRVLRNKSINHDKNISSAFMPKGEAQPWIDAVDIVCQQRRYPAITAVLTAFASPLLHFLQDNSVVMSFVSSASGTGKTTSLQLAQAVWGDPRRAMNQMDDTENSIFNKLGYMNSLPAYWDEVRTREDPGRFVRMMFQLTLGREKSRLTQSIEQRKMNTWETMLVLASNESFADHAKAVSEVSEAGRVRVFEIEVPKLDTDMAKDKSLATAVHRVFSNYGVVGVQYAEYLARNAEIISKLVGATLLKYSKTSIGASERLWLSTVTVLVVAAQLAKKLKLMDIDVAEYTEWIESELDKQRADIQESYQPPEEQASDVVTEFIAQVQPQLLICDKLPDGGDTSLGKIYSEPRSNMAPVGVVAIEDRCLRVRKSTLDLFIRDRYKVPPREVLKEFAWLNKQEPILGGKGAARVRGYEITLDKKHISGLD